MFKVQRSAQVPYSAQQMFELINDIESYPEFMTGCLAAEILDKGEDWIRARLTLGKKGIQKSFVTHNTLHEPIRMDISLVSGPFSHFEGSWHFDSLPENICKVSLHLYFDFSSPLLKMAIGKRLEKNAGLQVDELCQRAESVYGKFKG